MQQVELFCLSFVSESNVFTYQSNERTSGDKYFSLRLTLHRVDFATAEIINTFDKQDTFRQSSCNVCNLQSLCTVIEGLLEKKTNQQGT